MLAQLDLFAPPADENKKPESTRGRLIPPNVIVVREDSKADKPEAASMPSSSDTPVSELREEAPVPTPSATLHLEFTEQPSGPEKKEALFASEKTEDSVASEKQENGVSGKSSRGRKSIREMSRDAALVEIPADEQLFSKQYYGIGEVAAMFNVNASLLRFWESEFDILKPRKNKKGDRFFRPEDIKNLQQIHHLLRERKYTIEGAREFLKKSGRRQEQFEALESLKKIRAFLVGLKAGL